MRKQMEVARQQRLDDLNMMYPGAAGQASGAPSGSISSAVPQGGSMSQKGFKLLGTE